ncbi:MAG TPA: CRISPR-associated protein Cas4 [Thermotogota bacterium]|nr:CRISPR-associated protein Cas4 [Thermotogota bacterium]HPB87811.1 CRISPR-associated protein Cas4 [Thermotogota bacterium]HPH11469.1 CRISPR-associated protein Cas4 [Thermotogota bacterium]HQQ66468.1 CRISPR-associated protein Cas4 [Thermotogota bacterium]
MYEDQELIMISSLQHLVFCERQWALIFVERQWRDNVLTIEGKQLHERADSKEIENRPEVRIVRTLRLRSLELGLSGIADVIEFHRNGESGKDRWLPFPVEYKHGRERPDIADEVQLCAQALCLEEMLQTDVPRGAIFYGQPRRRMPVEFTPELRTTVKKLCERVRELIKSGVTPPPKYSKHCSNCSLVDECVPQIVEKRHAALYVEKLLIEIRRSMPGGLH